MRDKAHSNTAASVDLTPMLDVVFILLIFFIVTSTFIQEKSIGVEPPPPPGPTPSNDAAIIVEVNQEGLVRVNGRLTDMSGVRANMERLRAESPDVALIIQAHPQARSGAILQIRDHAYSAQMDRVNVVQTATK